MADVFELLRADHEEVEKMLSVLDESSAQVADADDWVPAARASVARWLVIESLKQEAVKEQFFWPVVRAKVPDGDEIAGQARRQEKQMVKTLARLHGADPATPQFDQMVGTATALVRDHIEFEETEVWPKLRAALRPADANRLGEQIDAVRNLAPVPAVTRMS